MVFTWGGTATDVTLTGVPAAGIIATKDMIAKTVTISGTPTADVSFTVTTVGTEGTPVSGSGDITIGAISDQNIFIHNFTTDGKVDPDNYYSISGNMNSTDGSTTYDGLTLTKRLKMETATDIHHTTTKTSTLTLVFDPTFAGKIKVNGITYTVPAAGNGVISIPNIPVGLTTITKGDVANLYYVKTVYDTTNLATGNISKDIDLAIYPNPATHTVFLKSDSEIQNISIFSWSGNLVKNVN